jgi:hypothetical protein
MNDDELIMLMKEPFAGVHMTMPADEVIRRGRTLRTRRRRQRGLTGAVALSGSAIAAVALLAPGGQPVTARLSAWTVTRDPDGGITVTVNQMKDPAGLQATLRADGVPARVTFDPVHAMNQPLPAGCTAPDMSSAANARLQGEILTPPAVWDWLQQQRDERTTYHLTYTVNGHVQHVTLVGTPAARTQKVMQLWQKYHVTIYVSGNAGRLPGSLQRLREKESQDGTGRSALYINPAAIPAGIGLSIGVDVASPSSFNVGVDLVAASSRCTGS